jgi:signal transduction histidine kinase
MPTDNETNEDGHLQTINEEIYKRNVELAHLYKELNRLNEELNTANEKLKGLDKLKTEFLSLATHQVRGPLTAIKGYASMVLDGDFGEVNAKAKEAISRIFESSNNLALIIEDFLNVSKIEGGGMKYEMVPFSLSEISRDMTRDLSITAEKRGLTMSFDGDPDADCMVNGDKEKVRQVVLNFIDNSIKYTKAGTIAVSVKKVDGKVVFKVTDTGMGMTPEIKESLFKKFVRGDGARMNTTGSGLGLYLAKEIVEAHKGRVWVDSEGPDKGSTFAFELDVIK